MTATLDATLDIPTLTTIPPDVAALQQEVRRWCQERVAPAVRALDEADAADFDWDLIQEGHDLGLTRLVVPKQLLQGVGLFRHEYRNVLHPILGFQFQTHFQSQSRPQCP